MIRRIPRSHRNIGRAGEGPICVVAILKDEERFLDEWIVYHRLIGVDRFILYDHDPAAPLRDLLRPHAAYVTVVDWGHERPGAAERTPQLRAYAHALGLLPPGCAWVAFIDGDEFIALRRHERLRDFLAGFEECGAVRLHWHVFGHDGHFDDPEGLVTASLTRRMRAPGASTKTIARPEAIESVATPHRCKLGFAWVTADANGADFSDELYPGKTDVAHVNHYQCRSFRRWMARAQRGDVSWDAGDAPPHERWRYAEDLLLRQFVTTVAKDKNEMVDEHMRRYESAIRAALPPRSPRSE